MGLFDFLSAKSNKKDDKQPLTYWVKFKTDNPEKASQLSELLKIDFTALSDRDVKEKIATVDRLCNQYQCSVAELKERCFKDLEKFPLFYIDQMIEMTEREIDKEIRTFDVAKENTVCYLLITWMKERKEILKNTNVYQQDVPEEESQENNLSPEESFKKRYEAILIKKIGNNAGNRLFCDDYDSPIAQELTAIMYAFLKDEDEIKKAEDLGYKKKYKSIIVKTTEEVIKQYCHAALQECIEYYNFPNKEVRTSFRCPYCGNWNVHYDDMMDQFECWECDHTWRAPLGYNLYL